MSGNAGTESHPCPFGGNVHALFSAGNKYGYNPCSNGNIPKTDRNKSSVDSRNKNQNTYDLLSTRELKMIDKTDIPHTRKNIAIQDIPKNRESKYNILERGVL